jgi:hypothetical protein
MNNVQYNAKFQINYLYLDYVLFFENKTMDITFKNISSSNIDFCEN